MSLLPQWYEWLARVDGPRVLEVGTKGWGDFPPKHQREEVARVNPGSSYVGLDLTPGPGVDVACDVHEVANCFPRGHFDAAICISTFEHLRRPWIAAQQLGTIIRSEGRIYIETCQCFPYHAYPADYFRFSAEALHEIFSRDAGWRLLASGYNIPAKVIPLDNVIHQRDWNFEAPSWLYVDCIAERI